MLSGRETVIFEALKKFDSKIADVFKGGIMVLEHRDNPERIAQSAHSLREVIYLLSESNVPKKLDDKGTSNHDEHETRMDDFIKSLDPLGTSPQKSYILHKKLFKKFDWLSKIAHHRKYPLDAEYRTGVEEYETYLEKIFELHFDVINKIKILSTTKPTTKNFDEIKYLISRNSSAYNYFFMRALPDWLPFLLRENYIPNPSHRAEPDNKEKLLPLHAFYLYNSASKKPDMVSQTILNLYIPEKYDGRRILLYHFANAAVEMPPKYGRGIAKKICKEEWIKEDPNIFDPSIRKLIKKMADAGFEDETVDLTYALLDVDFDKPHMVHNPSAGMLEFKKVQDVRSIIWSDSYREFLENDIPYIFKKFPEATTMLLIRLVKKTIILENKGRGEENSKTDLSAGWRSAIEDHGQNSNFGFKSALVGKLGCLMISVGTNRISLLRRILKKTSGINYPVFRRLELHVYRRYHKHFKNKINSAIEEYFDVYNLHHEYFHLIKDAFPHLSRKYRDKYLDQIDNGPDEDTLKYWRFWAQFERPDYLAMALKSWKINKLAPVKNHLTQKEKERFANFINEEGFSYPDFHMYISGVETCEPVTDLKDNLSPKQVIEFLKSYKPKKSGFDYLDGTAKKFQDYVHNDPNGFSKLYLQITTLSPIFIKRYFLGIREAAGSQNIGWEPVLLLCKKIMKSKQKRLQGNEMFYEIAHAIYAGIVADSINFRLRNKVWELLKLLADLEVTSQSVEKIHSDKDWNYFRVSLTTTDGITFHSVLCYAIWYNKHTKNKVFVPEVRKMLSNYLDHKMPHSVSRHAALSYYLPDLCYFDKRWIRSKLQQLFNNNDETLSKSAWEGRLEGRAYKDIFIDFIDKYDDHIQKLKNPSLNDGQLLIVDQRIIEHVVTAYLLGFDGAKELFNNMIMNSHKEVLSHCALHIGEILMYHKTKHVKSFDNNAFRKVWKNSKLTSNNELGTWVEHSPLDEKETLALLCNSLEKTDDVINTPFPVKELESYAKSHPTLTIKYLNSLIEKKKNQLELYNIDYLEDLLCILRGKDKAKTDALINRLGEFGLNTFGNLLENNKT